jgi:hypothetical protein
VRANNLVGHQHRHVAAKPVALFCDPDDSLGASVAQRGRVRVALQHVLPRRKVRVASLREHATRDPQERVRVARELLLVAAQKAPWAIRDPRMVGRDVVWHVVEDQRQVSIGELLGRCR